MSTTNEAPIHGCQQLSREAITYYFIQAWVKWDEAFDVREWMERGFTFNNADTSLYQALGLAGLSCYWPWEYRLPRTR